MAVVKNIATNLVAQNNTIDHLTVLEGGNLKWLTLIRVSVGLCSFLEAPGENLLSCLLQLLEAACISCLVAPSIYKVSNGSLSFFIAHHSNNDSFSTLKEPLKLY